MSNYCPNCGKKVYQRGNFCSSCGQKLIDKEIHRSIDVENTIEGATSKDLKVKSQIPSLLLDVFKNKKKLITVGIVAIALIIVLSINLAKPSPSDVAKEFIKDTQEKKYDKAQELWSQAGIDDMLSKLGDQRWIYQTMKNFTHRTNGDLDEFEIIKEEVNGDKATVYAKFIFNSGKRVDARLAMIKENGKWKVYAFGTN
ncbi:DUF4878 domain-containing protein [Microbacteriaceae bacterium 4G12]